MKSHVFPFAPVVSELYDSVYGSVSLMGSGNSLWPEISNGVSIIASCVLRWCTSQDVALWGYAYQMCEISLNQWKDSRMQVPPQTTVLVSPNKC